MAEISSNKSIAKNTLLLYFRTGLTMLISLYTSRVILAALGVEDNGIYNVVGGAVGMFGFLNGALAGATSRFLTFEIGRGDKERLKQTFSAALTAHIVMSLLVIILLETVGLWLLNQKLVIPEDRMQAAKWAYQFSVISTFFGITQVPYSASIISHEKMGAFAYMSILSAALKLGICYLVIISPFDKLITYSGLGLTVSILIRMIYRIYCIRRFDECHLIRVMDKGVFRPILTFSIWDLIGNLSVVARNQGIDVVLNMFFGPRINSAAGFAGTATGAVNGFANNFMTAIRPPIIKSYSIGDYNKMESLMIDASRYAFSLLMLLSTPFFFESHFILTLWLKNPPENSALFCSLGMTENLLASIFIPLVYAIHASGRIRFMSVINGTIWILSLPVSYFVLKAGAFPQAPYIVRICFLFFIVLSNIYSTKHNIPEFNVSEFLQKTILPASISGALVMMITYLVYIQFDDSSWIRFLSVCITTTITTCFSVFFIVFDKEMRVKVLNMLKGYIHKSGKAS